MQIALFSSSPENTRKIGSDLGERLPLGSVLALEGNLGSGKTVLVQGIAKGMGLEFQEVRSPTFALVQEYRGKNSLCHADLYRLNSDQTESLGLEEYWQSSLQGESPDWIVVIEWAERAERLLPHLQEKLIRIHFQIQSKSARILTFTMADSWKKILTPLQKKFSL